MGVLGSPCGQIHRTVANRGTLDGRYGVYGVLIIADAGPGSETFPTTCTAGKLVTMELQFYIKIMLTLRFLNNFIERGF